MAYAHNVWRVTISGTCFAGSEIWSTGFFVGYEDGDASVPTQQDADYIRNRWETFVETGNSNISSRYQSEEVKISHLLANGDTAPDNTIFSIFSPTVNGAGTIHPFPQLSLVCSLLSDVHGLGAKGRMFLPGFGTTPDTTARISSTDVGTIATNLETMFEGINTDLGIRGDIINASFGRTTPTPATGVNAKVTSIRVGNVLDTQRRRRNALGESYTTKTIT